MKHIPQRMCIVCRKSKDKDQLYKLKLSGNTVSVDESDFSQGRSVYICKDAECISKCRKICALDRAFKRKIDEVSYKNLLEKIDE